MKTAHEVIWENETQRLNREREEAEWSDLVTRARAPVWLGTLMLFGWWLVAAGVAYATIGARFSPGYALVMLSGVAIAAAQTLVKRRDGALRAIIERDAPALAEKLKRARVF